MLLNFVAGRGRVPAANLAAGTTTPYLTALTYHALCNGSHRLGKNWSITDTSGMIKSCRSRPPSRPGSSVGTMANNFSTISACCARQISPRSQECFSLCDCRAVMRFDAIRRELLCARPVGEFSVSRAHLSKKLTVAGNAKAQLGSQKSASCSGCSS